MEREKRTKKDWSKHQLHITEIDDLLIHELKKPDTRMQSVKFINTQGVMTATGDYGHWVFCREFHPSAEGRVSDHYWYEKMQIATSQEPFDFDPKATREEIDSFSDEVHKEWGLNDEELETFDRWVATIKSATYEHEIIYKYEAYMNHPGLFDAESVPYQKKPNPWIPIIFDAFDEICNRIEAQALAV